MTITLTVTPQLQHALAHQAALHGMELDVYATSLLEEATHVSAAATEREAAIERLKTFGKKHGLSLGGTSLRELRHEARP